MGSTTMGKVLVTAKIENLADLYLVRQGLTPAENVRSVEVNDALVDTGATLLSMPSRLIRQLGLTPVRVRRARTTPGVVDIQVYGSVQLTVQGRDCRTDVSEIPDVCPVLIGQIPLELLDFVVDPVGQRLIGNPDHGGEDMIDLF